MLNISNFMSEIQSAGVLRSNRYIMTFVPPKYLRDAKVDAGFDDNTTPDIPLDRIALRCESVQFPGMSFASVDSTPRFGYGPIESIPYGTIFDDITATFIVDSRSDVHRFFYKWVSSIVSFKAHGQSKLSDATNVVRGMKAYEVGYKDDYTTDIVITVYDENNNKVMTGTAYRAFPKLLPTVDLGWASNDEYVKLAMPFSYTDFAIEYVDAPSKKSPQESIKPGGDPAPAPTPVAVPTQPKSPPTPPFKPGGGSFGGGGASGSF